MGKNYVSDKVDLYPAKMGERLEGESAFDSLESRPTMMYNWGQITIVL